MTTSFLRRAVSLCLSLVVTLSPVFGVSVAWADSPNDLASGKVPSHLPANGNLPGGTPISVEITAPSDGALRAFPPGNIDLAGTASVGMGAVVKDTTIVYIMDISGSMSLDAGVDCNTIPGNDTRLACEKSAVRRANSLAKAAASSVDLTGLGSFQGGVSCATTSTAHDVNLGSAGSQLLVDPNVDGDGNGTADIEQVASTLNAGGGTAYICGLERADEILATSNNAINLIFFMSDGGNADGNSVSTFVPAHFGTNTQIHAFAMGAGVNCGSDAFGLGSLDDVAAKSTIAGGVPAGKSRTSHNSTI